MDSGLIGDSTLTSDEKRIEALLAENAALAAEVRSLTLGYRDAPRSAPMPTGRRLAAMLDERRRLIGELAEARTALSSETAHREQLLAHREQLLAHNRELAAEIEALRSGVPGLLRRARARLLRTRG